MAVTAIGRIARKNVRITFQKNEVYSDKYKNRLQRWTDYFSCYAYANTYTAQEKDGVVTTEERSVTFETRWCPELEEVTSTEYRIVFEGENYDIQSVDPVNYQRRELKFACRKEKREKKT